MKTVLHRADCADFGCHNSIRLETKHFLNTLALIFISFSGRFVFAMQKHYLFFPSDPLVNFYSYKILLLRGSSVYEKDSTLGGTQSSNLIAIDGSSLLDWGLS